MKTLDALKLHRTSNMSVHFLIPPRRLIGPLLLGVGSGALVTWSAGVSLGLFLAPLVFVVLLVPPMVSSPGTISERLVTGLVVVLGLIIIPLGASLASSRVDTAAVLVWCVVLLSLGAALVGCVALLHRLHLPWVFASALSTALALAWLTWPVWLAPHVSDDATIARLVVAHPLFATNALFPHMGIWTEQATAYRLTNLNQDVAYALPTSAWPSVVLHGLIAGGLLALSRVQGLRTSGARTVSAN